MNYNREKVKLLIVRRIFVELIRKAVRSKQFDGIAGKQGNNSKRKC